LFTQKISTGRHKDLGDVAELQQIWEKQNLNGLVSLKLGIIESLIVFNYFYPSKIQCQLKQQFF